MRSLQVEAGGKCGTTSFCGARQASWSPAARERLPRLSSSAAVVALNPVDKAEAWYQLALAHRAAGSSQDARRSVLRALEDAPHFERAQELLLQLHEARRP